MKDLLPKRLRIMNSLTNNQVHQANWDSWKQLNKDHKEMLLPYLIKDEGTQRFWKDVYYSIYHNQSVFLALTGRQGSGKTVFQYFIDTILKLPSKHIYSLTEYNNVVKDMPSKSHIAILDGTLLFPSRNFSSKEQKELQRQLNVFRAFSNVYSISFPFFEEADATIRKHFYECKILKVGQNRLAEINHGDSKYTIKIPNIDDKTIQDIHKIDLSNKKSNL